MDTSFICLSIRNENADKLARIDKKERMKLIGAINESIYLTWLHDYFETGITLDGFLFVPLINRLKFQCLEMEV